MKDQWICIIVDDEGRIVMSNESYLDEDGNQILLPGYIGPYLVPWNFIQNQHLYRLKDGVLALDQDLVNARIECELAMEKEKLLKERNDLIIIKYNARLIVNMAEEDDAVALSKYVPEWDGKRTYKRSDCCRYNNLPYRALHDIIDPYTADIPSESNLWTILHAKTFETALPFTSEGHNPYMTGEWIIYKDNYYKCLADNVVHNPDELPTAWDKKIVDVIWNGDAED